MNVKIEHLQKFIGIDHFKDRLKTADKNIVQLVCTAFAIHRIICNNAVYIFKTVSIGTFFQWC